MIVIHDKILSSTDSINTTDRVRKQIETSVYMSSHVMTFERLMVQTRFSDQFQFHLPERGGDEGGMVMSFLMAFDIELDNDVNIISRFRET